MGKSGGIEQIVQAVRVPGKRKIRLLLAGLSVEPVLQATWSRYRGVPASVAIGGNGRSGPAVSSILLGILRPVRKHPVSVDRVDGENAVFVDSIGTLASTLWQ